MRNSLMDKDKYTATPNAHMTLAARFGTFSLAATLVFGCGPETVQKIDAPITAHRALPADRPGEPLSSAALASFASRWGTDSCAEYLASDYVCNKTTREISNDGFVKAFLWNLDGSFDLSSEGYLAQDPKGRTAIYVMWQFNDGDAREVSPPQPISHLRIRTEAGVPVLETFWMNDTTRDPISRELRTTDLKKGYSIGYKAKDNDTLFSVLPPNITPLTPSEKRAALNAAPVQSTPQRAASSPSNGNIGECFKQTFDYPEGPPDDPSGTYHVNDCGRVLYCQVKPAWEINGQETWDFRSYVGLQSFTGGAWSHSLILSTCTFDESKYKRPSPF